MLRGVRELYSCAIGAVGGEIGRVRDAYFDDRQWPLRYFVVDIGHWPGGRQVLISPRSVTETDHDRKLLHTSLTTAQFPKGLRTDTEVPVSRQQAVDFSRSDGFPRYRLGDEVAADVPYAAAGVPGALTALAPETCDEEPWGRDPHLRSTRAVTHHYVHALDGDVGHVADFLYEETSWRIRYVVAVTGSWWPGRKVLVPVGWVSWLSWDVHTVNVQLHRETIQLAPAYNAVRPATEEYLARLAAYYASPPE